MDALKFDRELEDGARSRLRSFERRSLTIEGLVAAAVACAIVGNSEDEATFVLTRRTSRLKNHGGQWALPGGRVEAGESPVQAALRELQEEVGISISSGSVLGLLDDFITRSGFAVTPIVVWGPSRAELAPDPREVAAAYLVPLRSLARPEIPRIVPGPEPDRPLVTIPLEVPETVVYAPTAAMIYQLREVVLFGRSTRVDGFGEPSWAWS